MAVIYGLIDPRDGQLRYVGKALNVTKRVRQHLTPGHLAGSTHVARWLRGLVRGGLRPEVETLDESDAKTIYALESFWIQYFRMIGCRLTNLLDGGPGGSFAGRRHTDVAKERIRAARARQVNPRLGTKHSPETIALFRSQRQHRTLTAEWRMAIGDATRGRRHSAATKEMMSKAHAGRPKDRIAVERAAASLRGYKHTPAAKANMAAAHRGSKRTEKTKARMRAAWAVRRARQNGEVAISL